MPLQASTPSPGVNPPPDSSLPLLTPASTPTHQDLLSLTRHRAYLSQWRAECRYMADAELGLHLTWLRRTLILAEDEALPAWYADALREDLGIAEEAWNWRLRAERKGGPRVGRASFRERLERARARHDLVGLIGRCVALKRTGAEWKGLCPFHQEDNPSFFVHPERGVYHCFGCGEGGDVFTWLMHELQTDLLGALEWLERAA